MIFVDRADAERRTTARPRHLQGADLVCSGAAARQVAVTFVVAQELVMGTTGSTYRRSASAAAEMTS